MKNLKGKWTSGFTAWGCPCSVYVIGNKIKKAKYGFGFIDPKFCKIANKS